MDGVGNFEIVPSVWFDTQMFTPSKTTPQGFLPAENKPRFCPSTALNLVILSLPKLVTHIIAPSKANKKAL